MITCTVIISVTSSTELVEIKSEYILVCVCVYTHTHTVHTQRKVDS